MVNNASYTAAEPEVGATAPIQGAPDKVDATVDATPPSTCARTGATAEAALASCTGMDEGLVPGANPHAPIPVAHAATPTGMDEGLVPGANPHAPIPVTHAATPAPAQPQCVNCQPNPVTCDLSCWHLILLDKTWTAMHCCIVGCCREGVEACMLVV